MANVRVGVVGPVTVVGRTVATPLIPIPGIGAGVAYADEDAFGLPFTIDGIPRSGIIQTLLVVDEDDENLDVDLFLFRGPISQPTDNSAYAPTANDLNRFEGLVSNAFRHGVSGATVGNNDGIGKSYHAPEGRLHCQAVARGALSIAAGKRYMVALRILADEA